MTDTPADPDFDPIRNNPAFAAVAVPLAG